jgi:hypothetical protein
VAASRQRRRHKQFLALMQEPSSGYCSVSAGGNWQLWASEQSAVVHYDGKP